MSECQKEKWHGCCCCNCKYHLRDHPVHIAQYAGAIPISLWVCAPDVGEQVAYSGWSEHGMCERHTFKEAK